MVFWREVASDSSLHEFFDSYYSSGINGMTPSSWSERNSSWGQGDCWRARIKLPSLHGLLSHVFLQRSYCLCKIHCSRTSMPYCHVSTTHRVGPPCLICSLSHMISMLWEKCEEIRVTEWTCGAPILQTCSGLQI